MWRFLAVMLIAASAALAGCTGGGGLVLVPKKKHVDKAELWQLPVGSYPSQRLYRVNYQGPEGKAGFRLTLYLAESSRYRMEAADKLGRRVWSLGVEKDSKAVFLDHRQELYCTSQGGSRQSFVPIAHLPLGSLPLLILGRIPALPAEDIAQAEGKLSFLDAQGQLWNAEATGDDLSWWSLIKEGEAVAWWRRIDDRFVFSDRRGGQQVTWREQVKEQLARELEPLKIPDAYREGACGATLASDS